ncbi:MAG: GTPase [Thermoplasmata archaeon HGW-Thermoplasmata-1]|nr:MAG: GTPase [Thermoplasmata archaeon HGW-Thermoplasmata-1]
MFSKKRTKVLILGAAGRDFHNFNTFFRNNKNYEVVAFTATQIPDIEGRLYPKELAGKLYPHGIPIYDEKDAMKLIKELDVDQAVLAYSDLPYPYVMEKSAMVNAAGADFILMGPKHTMIKSKKPVIAITATRTGCGKSQTSRAIFKNLVDMGYRVASIRHPMPYDQDLNSQTVQRFASYEDLDRYRCTIEEREEYEPYIEMGGVIYAGVDYAAILKEAEKEADVIIWDGGNNDFAFYKPDLYIAVADPHRAGHEVSYYPSEVNMRMADIIIINKVDTAKPKDIKTVEENAKRVNPAAKIIKAFSPVTLADPEAVRGKKVLVVEDGPTLTHGSMKYGAGKVAAEQGGAREIVDPRPCAVGSIIATFEKYNHLTDILPAMGYGKKQISELEETINNCDAEVVIGGTPIDLSRIVKVNKPIVRVKYEMAEESAKELMVEVKSFLDGYKN